MNIRIPKTVRQEAGRMLSKASMLKKILLIFCGILLAQCLAVSLLQQVLDGMVSRSGGLSNLGTRTILSTIQMALPFLHMLVLMGLELGLLAAMLRISRGQYTSPQTLRQGIARYWSMLRCRMLQLMLYMMVGMIALNGAIVLFFMTPMGQASMEIMLPYVQSGADAMAATEQIFADEQQLSAFLESVWPLYVIFFLLLAVLALPVYYRTSMADFVLLDDPRAGAFRAVVESSRMTRGNAVALLKLDLSFWWYYVLSALILALSYGDLILPLLGITLPMSQQTVILVFYGLYLLAQVAVYYFLRPRLQVSKALIYNAIRPREEPQKGVVLGNIFQNQ